MNEGHNPDLIGDVLRLWMEGDIVLLCEYGGYETSKVS